jgi:hypothetical protein
MKRKKRKCTIGPKQHLSSSGPVWGVMWPGGRCGRCCPEVHGGGGGDERWRDTSSREEELVVKFNRVKAAHLVRCCPTPATTNSIKV